MEIRHITLQHVISCWLLKFVTFDFKIGIGMRFLMDAPVNFSHSAPQSVNIVLFLFIVSFIFAWIKYSKCWFLATFLLCLHCVVFAGGKKLWHHKMLMLQIVLQTVTQLATYTHTHTQVPFNLLQIKLFCSGEKSNLSVINRFRMHAIWGWPRAQHCFKHVHWKFICINRSRRFECRIIDWKCNEFLWVTFWREHSSCGTSLIVV